MDDRLTPRLHSFPLGRMFALPFDLNVYAAAHNRAFTCDWTGNPAADLAHDRTKRFFLESRCSHPRRPHGFGYPGAITQALEA